VTLASKETTMGITVMLTERERDALWGAAETMADLVERGEFWSNEPRSELLALKRGKNKLAATSEALR